MRFLRAKPSMAVWLLIGGFMMALSVGFGIADVLKHESLDVGSGRIVGRYTQRGCVRPAACTNYHLVGLQLDGATGTAVVGSDALYDRVGDPPQTLRVEDAKSDTFTHRISELRVEGRDYATYDRGAGILWFLVPLATLGLVCFLMAAAALRAPFARRLVARTPTRRKVRVGIGLAVTVFCVAVTAAGLSGDSYDLGPGVLKDRFETLKGRFIHEGAVIHTSFGVDHRVDSPTLYRLLAGKESLPVTVVVSAGEVNGVRYRGRFYSEAASDYWYGLIGLVPLALLFGTMAWLNVRALRANPLQRTA